MTEQDKAALAAAEEHIMEIYCNIHRSVIEKSWGYSDDELAKIEYNRDGYPACGISSSEIVEHFVEDGTEQWIIEIVPDMGPPMDAERWRVYQAEQPAGAWIIEAE